MYKKTLQSLAILWLIGCAESNFEGNNGTSAPSQPQSQNQVAQPSCDLSRDFVTLSNLPPQVAQCEANGGFFYYLDNRCYPLSSAKVECDFNQVKSLLSNYGIPTRTVDEAISKNAKIVDCRHIPEKKTVAVNWWYTSGNQNDCNYQEGLNLVTACYPVLPAGSAPKQISTEQDHAQHVRNCLNAL